MTTKERPTGGRERVSDILRNLYLVPKTGTATLEERFSAASGGVATADLPKHIETASLQFARLWFAKDYYSANDSWTVRPEGKIEDYAGKFDQLHEAHKQSGKPEDQLDGLIKDFMKELSGPVR